jgi:hypothetical protein
MQSLPSINAHTYTCLPTGRLSFWSGDGSMNRIEEAHVVRQAPFLSPNRHFLRRSIPAVDRLQQSP